MIDDRTDDELFSANTEDANTTLYNRHHDKIVARLVRSFGDYAEDAFLIAFTRVVVERRETFRPVNFPAWLYKIARYDAIDHVRKENRQHRRHVSLQAALPHGDSFEPESGEPTAEAAASHEETCQKLTEKVRLLGPENQQFIKLCFHEGRNYAEIAGIMGWSKAKVRVRMFRLKDELRLHADELN